MHKCKVIAVTNQKGGVVKQLRLQMLRLDWNDMDIKF